VLETAARAGALETVLVAQERLSSYTDVLDDLAPTVTLLTLPLAAMSDVVGFDIHRGVLGFGRRPVNPPLDTLLGTLPGEAPWLVLEGLTNTDNVGACFRNAAGLGADAVILDPTCADPLYRRALRVAVGHSLTVPWTRAPMVEVIETLGDHGIRRIALAL